MNSLEHAATGHYVVATESGSRYLIDFGRRVIVRLPNADDELYVTMRGDFYQVQLLRLMECVVGGSMWLRISLGVPGVLFTDRRTSPVVAIVYVPDDVVDQELDSLIRPLGQERQALLGPLEQLPEEVQLDGDR
ncbi:hypothetical protein ASC66_09160 [Leifsonia sp. Root4]|uniref:hypothetical protein n=1 Tax=Leifsonia sp. Root4 TaxID=1736525 RepID=UPI0006F96A94|nr:hypothetical protein [Leifsonia sp. Root4]KQW06620.1 hypothetical protein ASC66_09160 [Leifsonia sp. Root4]